MEKKFTQLIYHGFITCLFFLATTLQAQVTQVFTYTGNTQTFTVPAGVTSLQIKAWGAGGGGSNAFNEGGSGGSGAFVTTSLTVIPGQVYTIQVGGGGRSGEDIKAGGYAGGGTGGRQSGSGGGYSAIFFGNTIGSNVRIVAGGGGGGAYESKSTYGGAGDGADAANMSSTITGGKTAGASGRYNNDPRGATAGTPYQGGKGSTTYSIGPWEVAYDNGGGGGGGGVRGGGGGVGSNGWFSYDSTGGGGGSSYTHPTLATSVLLTAGNTGSTGGWVSAPGNTDSGYIAGVGRGGANRNSGGNGLIVITYTEGECTDNPTGGSAVLTPNTGTVGSLFTANVTGGTIGALGLTYEWEMSVGSATGPWTAIPGATTASVQLTAPNEPPGTKIYYRRKITCVNSGSSRNSNAAEYTIYSPSYCDPASFINNDYYIKGVRFLGTLNDVQNLNNGYSNNPKGYQDWTGLGTYASQEQGGAINLAVENSRESVMAAWVDWNNNGNFEAGEQIYNTAGSGVGSTIIGFSVPAAQAIGYYRIRIRVSANPISNNPTTNCQDFTNGETEDYLFQVLKACDAKVTSFAVSEVCGPAKLPITINTVNATSVKIYTAENANNPIASVNVTNNSATYTTALISETTVYYVAAANGTCEARNRVKIIAKVNPLPNIDFDNTVREFCGDASGTQTLQFAALGDKETVELVNENFNTNLGVFTATQAGQNIAAAAWIHRTSNFIPGSPSVIQPAIASGISGDGFAASVTDVGPGTNRTNHLTTTASFNTTGFLNLHLDYNIYTFFEGIKPDVEKVNVEVSQDNGVNWVVLKTYSPTSTGNVGLPNKFMEETLDLNAFINVAALKVRFSIYAFATSGQWSGDIGAVDKVRLYGEKPLTAAFSWSVVGGDAILYNDDCVTPYNGATNSICVKPSSALLETKPSWTIEAEASLSNGCSATGSVNIINNNRTWNNTARTNWNQNYWTPSGIPDQDKCVLIKTPIGITNTTNALAKNIRIETTAGATGKLTVNGSLTVTDGITNTGLAENFIVKSDANLLQINENPNLNTTPISVRRLFTWSGSTDATRREYNFLSSPVYNQNMKEIYGGVASHVPYVTKLNESTNLFVNATLADYTKQAKGFAVREPKTSFTGVPTQGIEANEAEYKGVPNNGTISINLDWTSAGRGYNVVGNPYPSNIDIVKLYANSVTNLDTPEIDANFRFWDNTVNATYVQMGGAYQGYSYAIFNAISQTSTAAPGLDPNPGGGNTTLKAPGKIIKVNQAFMIRALQGGASMKFNNTMRETTQTGSVFYGKESPHDRYRLQLSTAAHFVVQNAVTYFPQGNNAFGPEDARIPNSTASDALFTYAGDAKVVINGRSMFDSSDVIPLGTRHFTAGTYRIQAVDLEGVFANGQSIYLKDKALNIFTDLTQGDYTFTSESGEFTNRFEIVYRPGVVLATDTKELAKVEVYRDAADFVIRSSDKAISYLELYDASGRLIFTLKGSAKELRFAADRLADGMYVLKTNLKDGEVMTAKIRK
ncbi:GEVED domain-containing protein [Kaistella sp. BT6-1-3]|uniref:GEVED domain-containing protein n=1 Tax=Kaistella yananensis TaxID=2989820 RepID=A0ABT3JJ46_9FLAO|nr:GEVED domain-containing protein [Kaistella yananensis]MCW4450802.1 GEVED domain-containing protein [Kaistella yananensis]